ncbi:MAG: MFS transporter [Nitrososphaerota archaeon]|nr:MFS transporter [Nitrososphaerota archaeon]
MKNIFTGSHERILDYTTFLLTVSFQLTLPILPIYLYAILGASEQEVGVIIALASISSAVTRIPSSILVMRENALRIFILSVGLNTISLIGYTLSADPWTLAFFRILHGISFALSYTLMLSFASLIVRPDGVSKSIMNYTASLALGLWIGPATGVLLSSFLDLRMLILSAALISLAPISLAIAFTKKRPKFWGDIYYSKAGADVFKVLLKGPLILPTALHFLYSTVIGALFAYAPLKASNIFGIPDQLVIFIFTGYYFIAFVLRIILSRPIPRLGDVTLLRIAMASCALGIFIAGIAQDVWLFVLGIFLVAVAQGLAFPITAIMMAHVAPPNLRIIGNAIYLTSWDLGGLLGPIMVASLLYFAPLSMALAATSIFAAISLFLIGKIAEILE